MFSFTTPFSVSDIVLFGELLSAMTSEPPNFLHVYLAAWAAFTAFEQLLRWRQIRQIERSDKIPPELAKDVTAKEFAKARNYQLARERFGFVSDLHAGVSILAFSLLLRPMLWAACVGALERQGLGEEYQIARALVFVTAESVINWLYGLPLNAYSTWVIEQRFGFNKYTWGRYAGDKVKGLLIETILNGIMFAGMVALLNSTGKNAWFYLWVFISVLVLVLNILYPIVLAPLFNKFTPLEPGKTRDRIDALITQTGLQCKDVFMVDGSKQSSHSNAYVAGLCGSKRIVIYDTLIKDLNEDLDAVCAVVGHEIGHSTMNHTYVQLFVAQVQFFALFWTFGFFINNPRLITDFGYAPEAVGTCLSGGGGGGEGGGPGFCAFLTIYCFMTVYSQCVSPLVGAAMNFMTRRMEFQADEYSAKLGMKLQQPLVTIAKKNAGVVHETDWLHSMWHHSHPPLLERLAALKVHEKAHRE